MMRINLLPHRAHKRKVRQAQFVAFSVISLLLGVLVVGFVHTYISSEISYQERRNQYLKQEIEFLNKQIAEINKLREQTESLLARKTVVENLQTTRSDVVHLIDQMLRILPDGVYLKSVKQVDSKISLVGYAQSNARVSTLMRAIDNSPWLELPALVEIHATTASGARVSEFTLNFSLKKQAPATPSAPAKPSATKG
ncbi:MAG: type IV pilus assembly protein PilN [Gallionellaceae bacterium]|nr:MAG: type IV pilus assembly protein PilN [Gallionellaceae bacterium]